MGHLVILSLTKPILNCDYNNSFKNLKICFISLKNALNNFSKEIHVESETGARFEPATNRLQDNALTDWTMQRVKKFCTDTCTSNDD